MALGDRSAPDDRQQLEHRYSYRLALSNSDARGDDRARKIRDLARRRSEGRRDREVEQRILTGWSLSKQVRLLIGQSLSERVADLVGKHFDFPVNQASGDGIGIGAQVGSTERPAQRGVGDRKISLANPPLHADPHPASLARSDHRASTGSE